MAGLLRSLLTGQGAQGLQKYLTRSGVAPAINHLGAALDPPAATGGLRGRALARLKYLAFGHRGGEVLKQRFVQGGLAGKSGLIRGQLAPSANWTSAAQQHGGYLKALGHKPGLLVDAGGAATQYGMMAGIPAYTTYKAMERGDNAGVGRALGEGLGWFAAAPFNFAGAGLAIGSGIVGERLLGPSLPQLHSFQPSQMYAEAPQYDQMKMGSVLSPVRLK